MNIRAIGTPVLPQLRKKFWATNAKPNQPILVIQAPWKSEELRETSPLSLVCVKS